MTGETDRPGVAAEVAPGWYPDPWIAGGLRFWDGSAWTVHVAAKVIPPDPPHQRLPLPVALWPMLTLVVSLVGSKYVLDWLVGFGWPIFVYVVISGLVGYGPTLLVARYASHRWGTGSLRADSGFYLRKIDLGLGPLTWLACVAVQATLVGVIMALDIPFVSNLEGVDDLGYDRGYVITTVILAVLVAPVAEEMLFRGVVMRGLLSRMGPVLVIAVQAVVFGLAHVDPVRGLGNIGLVILLSGVGVVLGVSEYRVRRLGPPMIAHGIINSIAMLVVLLG